MNRLASGVRRLDDLLARPVSMRSLAVLRIAVGMVAFVHLRRFTTAAWRGDTFDDRFHRPYVDALAALPDWLHLALLTAGLAGAIAMIGGLATRIACWTTFGVVAYHLLLSTTHVHNNRVYLAIVLGLLAVAPTDRAFSIDELIRRRREPHREAEPSPGWPLWLLRFECSIVYAASGFSKLIDPDWFGGTVTWLRVRAAADEVQASPLPSFVTELLLDRSFHTLAAKVIVLTELVIAAGLWIPWLRRWIVASAIVFHVMIEIGADVELFSYLAVAVLIVWADPALPWLRRLRRDEPMVASAPVRLPRVSP